jgi:hypothetical protein
MFSPKWFNISIFYVIIIIIVYYTLIFFPFAFALPFALDLPWSTAREESKAKEKINPLKRNKVLIYPVENKIKNIKFKKLKNKSRYLINSLNRREYSTLFHLNKNVIDKISCSAYAPFPSDLQSSDKALPCLCFAIVKSKGRATGPLAGERLNTILKELELNPVYVFENLNNENIKTQIFN